MCLVQLLTVILRFFLRKNEDEIIDIPIAIITDLDIKDNSENKSY